MKLDLVQQLGKFDGMEGQPLPVHDWNPSVAGEIDIKIDATGRWFHEGDAFTRDDLMKLFSRILRLDEDGEYYLVTPAEKMKITVEDAPFVALLMEVEGTGEDQVLSFITNAAETVKAGKGFPLRFSVAEDGDVRPYVMIRDGLEALISRNVFYQLMDLLAEEEIEGKKVLGIWSSGVFYQVMDSE